MFLPCLAAIRPSRPQAVTGPLAYPTPVAPSSATSTDDRACSVVCQRNAALDIMRIPLVSFHIFQMFNIPALVPDTLHRSPVHRVLRLDEAPRPSGLHNKGVDDASGPRRKRYLSCPSFVRPVRAPKRRSEGEAPPAAVPNPPALAAGHPCDFDILPRVRGLGLQSSTHQRALRQVRTPRSPAPHLTVIHTQYRLPPRWQARFREKSLGLGSALSQTKPCPRAHRPCVSASPPPLFQACLSVAPSSATSTDDRAYSLICEHCGALRCFSFPLAKYTFPVSVLDTLRHSAVCHILHSDCEPRCSEQGNCAG
jgi:hypothetical protein